MFKDFPSTVRRLIKEWVTEHVETTLPGTVIDITGYEETQQIAVVQPLLNIVYEDNQAVEMAYLYNVPVELTGTQESLFSVPLKVGDTVKLNFSKRNIDTLKEQAVAAAHNPSDRRWFDTNDATAFPTVLNKPANLNPSASHVEIKFKDILVSYQDDGTIINTNGVVTTTYSPDGTVEITNGEFTETYSPDGTKTFVNPLVTETFNSDGTLSWDNGEIFHTYNPNGSVSITHDNFSLIITNAGLLTYTAGASDWTVQNGGLIRGNNNNGSFELQPAGAFVANGCTIDITGNVITANGTDLDQLRTIYNSHTHEQQNDTGGSTEFTTDPPNQSA